MSSSQICNLIRSENLSDNYIHGISFEWDADGWLHVHGTQDSLNSVGVTSAKTPIHLEAGDYVISAEVDGGGLGTYKYVSIWPTDNSLRLAAIDPENWYGAFSVAKPVDICLWCYAAGKGATVDYRMRFMLVEGTTPAAWAPADGEELAGGGALMSANLLDGATVMRGTKDADGYWVLSQNDGTDKKDSPMWRIDGQPTLTENQTVHMACSVMPDEDWGAGVCNMGLEYRDAAGGVNWVGAYAGNAKAGVWTRLEFEVVVPSGMRVDWGLLSNAYRGGSGAKVTGVTISYGSPVCLASSAHTPYATQDHVAAEYATKASLKVTDDRVTAEVTERGKLAGRVGTLESTTGTHTSKLQQLAASITSLVKGESTYTDPDGKSATSGIYSLVEQTRDSVTALFASYTKTADLASTTAVKDAKKAGTDAASAASAAQSTANAAKSAASTAQSTADAAKSTADGLATMIRQDADGVTVGKSADGKTWSTTRTRMGASAFEVLTKAGEVASSFGEKVIELGKNSQDATISMLAGLARIVATKLGGVAGIDISSGSVTVRGTGGGFAVSGAFPGTANGTGAARVEAVLSSEVPTVIVSVSETNDKTGATRENRFEVTPDGYALSKPSALRAAVGSYGPVSPSSQYGSLTFCVRAGVATLWVSWGTTADSWGKMQCGEWVVPEGYRPRMDLNAPVALRNRGTGDTGDTRLIVEASTGKIYWQNLGGGHSATTFDALVSWGIE